MHFSETQIASVYIIDVDTHTDDRGGFSRIFCRKEDGRFDIEMDIVQANRSFNIQAGTVRGLHYQIPPASEDKRVLCLKGSIYDVVLDIRKDSPTFLQWIGIELSAQNRSMLHIPKGCAHGFQTLEPDTEILYFHSAPYSHDHYRGIRYNDPLVDIRFPLPVANISEKDAALPDMGSKFAGILA